jgi:hypothetical protein
LNLWLLRYVSRAPESYEIAEKASQTFTSGPINGRS